MFNFLNGNWMLNLVGCPYIFLNSQLTKLSDNVAWKDLTPFLVHSWNNCWCVKGQGHPINRISWTEKATSRTKAIPVEDIEWAKAMTGQYKRFRKVRQRTRVLDKRLNTLLDELEQKIVGKTKKCKSYLE